MTKQEQAVLIFNNYYLPTPSIRTETYNPKKHAKICATIDIQGKIDLIYSLPISKEYGPVEDYVNHWKEVLEGK